MRCWEFVLVLVAAVIPIFAQECVTPNGNRAQCQLLGSCSPLVSYMQRTPVARLTSREKHYINMLLCYTDYMQEQYVCCASNDPFYQTSDRLQPSPRPPVTTTTKHTTTTTTTNRPQNDDINFPDPLNFECGGDVIKDRIVGGNETDIGEYPWMALLEYEQIISRQRSISCGGSLIHKRYVLTAAHCIVGAILRIKGNLVNVRLGEHKISTDPDCITEENEAICADPVINAGVEQTKPHPRFALTNNQNNNDIGLIRLDRDVETTLFIQPICFPPIGMNSQAGTKLMVSGWGRTNTRSGSDVKLHVSVPIVNFVTCQQSIGRILIDDQVQLCAGGEFGKDSCNGDSGGPLMTIQNGTWYIEGVVSFGASTRCGTPGIPAIYTRVNAYRAWVLNLIQSGW